jgi:hypothetical protein
MVFFMATTPYTDNKDPLSRCSPFCVTLWEENFRLLSCIDRRRNRAGKKPRFRAISPKSMNYFGLFYIILRNKFGENFFKI